MKKKSKRFDPMGKDYDEEMPTAHGAKTLARTRIEVAAHQLRSAPWNPRREVTSESVADITASIRELGLIQPLVVMKDPDKKPFGGVDFYLVVAGHRRFRACVDAGLSPIPCDLVDCDVQTAKRVTMIENLQRKDVDPLMEAELVAGLLADGMTQAEIAAETGRGERWVARRANLVKLSPSWRKSVEDGEDISIDCLEHIAAYPEEIQEKCKGAHRISCTARMLLWPDVRWEFERESRDLKAVLFDTTKCRTCTNNTGCCPDLFDGDGGALGKCLDAKCYERMTGEAIDAECAKAEKKGREVIHKEPCCCGVYGGGTKRPTKENTTLYVFTDYNGRKVMEYAAPPKRNETKGGGDDAEKRKATKERNKAIRKLAEWCKTDGNLERCIKNWGNIDIAAAWAFQTVFNFGSSWRLFGTKTNTSDAALGFLLDPDWHRHLAPVRWAGDAAAAIVEKLTKNMEVAQMYAAKLLAIWPGAADALADEERQLIATDAELEKLRSTSVEWDAGKAADEE